MASDPKLEAAKREVLASHAALSVLQAGRERAVLTVFAESALRRQGLVSPVSYGRRGKWEMRPDLFAIDSIVGWCFAELSARGYEMPAMYSQHT